MAPAVHENQLFNQAKTLSRNKIQIQEEKSQLPFNATFSCRIQNIFGSLSILILHARNYLVSGLIPSIGFGANKKNVFIL